MNKAGVDKAPQFKPTGGQPETKQTSSSSMELSELDTDSMLGKNQSGVTSMALGSGAGGVKVMGGQQSGFGDTPTFEVSKNIESFRVSKKQLLYPGLLAKIAQTIAAPMVCGTVV